MTFQHVLLISSGDRQLTKNLAIARPICKSVDDYSLKATYIDAYELKARSAHTSDHAYPLRKTGLCEIFSKTPTSNAMGDVVVNRVYFELQWGSQPFFHTFFQSFGYNPKASSLRYPTTLLNCIAVVEYETATMSSDMMNIAEAIHLSNVDTQVWHFYTSPYPQGFGLYNTFDKQMHIIDGSKLLQQIWYANDPDFPELKIYNPMLAEMFNRLFELSFEMWQNEMQKDRVAAHKPGASQFSIYNNQNPSNKDSK